MKNPEARTGPASRERTLLWKGEPVVRFTLPETALPAGTPRRVARYYRRLEAAWRKRWEGAVYRRACAALEQARAASRPFAAWTAELTAEAAIGKEGLLQVRWEAAETLGGRRCVLRGGEVWRLPGGAPAVLRDFFPDRTLWKRQVLEQVAEQIRRRADSGETCYWSDWPVRLRRAFDPDRFLLTEDGLQVYFPLCSIAPWFEGVPVFPVRCGGEN